MSWQNILKEEVCLKRLGKFLDKLQLLMKKYPNKWSSQKNYIDNEKILRISEKAACNLLEELKTASKLVVETDHYISPYASSVGRPSVELFYEEDRDFGSNWIKINILYSLESQTHGAIMLSWNQDEDYHLEDVMEEFLKICSGA